MGSEELNTKDSENPLKDKSYDFAIRIVKLAQHLQKEKKEFGLSKQVLRSGTAIGALIREAEFGQSKADFGNKMSIALVRQGVSLQVVAQLLGHTTTRMTERYTHLAPDFLRAVVDSLPDHA